MSQIDPHHGPARPHPVRPPRPDLNIVKILGGALAAASAAVASSWLGVAGTVFGAVVVSVVATVGTALYSHSLERSRYAIRETIPALTTRTRTERGVGTDTMVLSVADADPPRRRVDRQGRPISWPTVTVSCLATLVLGLGALTGFEAVVGKSAADLTGSSSSGGTTLGSLVGGGGSQPAETTPNTPSTPTHPTHPTRPTTPSTPTTTGPASTSPTTPTTTNPGTTTPTQTQPTDTQPTQTQPTGTGTTTAP